MSTMYWVQGTDAVFVVMGQLWMLVFGYMPLHVRYKWMAVG